MKSFDVERLNLLPLESVLDSLGVEFSRKDYMCPYPHKKPQPLKIKNNMCMCYNCKDFPRPDDQKFGGPIAVAQYMLKTDFVEACKWLHEAFNVPYLDGTHETQKARVLPKMKKREIEYITFDPFNSCNTVALKDYMGKYHGMSNEQRIKMVYTFLYRHSLKTEQKPKYGFYKKERGISSNSTYLQTIGYLSQDDLKEVLVLMKKYFGDKDLLEFGILKEDKDNLVFSFDYINKGGLLMVPSFDLYTDMVTAFMVRPTHPAEWMKKRGLKELQLSKSHIIKPLPFGLTCKALKENNEFFITEGHPDLASIPGNINGDLERAGIASPGTHGFREEMMSLLRGKKVVLVYDQDFSGQKAELGYHELVYSAPEEKRLEFLDTKDGRAKLKERISRFHEDTKYTKRFHMGMRQKLTLAGVKDIQMLTWNRNLGGDINDLRINGNLSLVFK